MKFLDRCKGLPAWLKSWFLVLAVAGVLVGSHAPRITQAGQLAATDKGPAGTYEVDIIQDVPYYEGPDADKHRHRLDLYLPRGGKDFPVLFFVHGGAWMHGDKSLFGRHKPIGVFWASHGVGVVMTNYRLSPAVRHPGHIQDVARAFAWTYKNIPRYNGRPDQIFAFGHSAGGHLVALLATNDTYLKAEGLSLQAIRGVIPMSGLYHIPANNSLFDAIFGTDPKVRREASPLSHARPDAPPFLILYADHDLSLCNKKLAEAFCQALQDKKAVARTVEVKERNHVTIFFKATREDDPAAQAMRDFIRTCTEKK